MPESAAQLKRLTARADMQEAARLAGFFAAHAVWCVSDGGPLVPLGGFAGPDGQRHLARFGDELLEQAVERGKEWLATNHDGAAIAAFIYDGYVTLPSGKTDALILEARCFEEPVGSFTMALPYRPSDHPKGFAVYRPKFFGISCSVEQTLAALGEAFFAGVDEHERGSAVWNNHLDQSQ